MNEGSSTAPRQRVAREAALLLFTSQEKEYKQAKLRAAHTLGARILPTNAQVAEELDKIADEMEGSSRREGLHQKRREALHIMKKIVDFCPTLIGSVWRGTAHKDSDIDIVTFSTEPANVLRQLQRDFKVTKTEWQSSPKMGAKGRSFHIYLVLPSGNEVEVVVRSMERINQKEKCEIYGDFVAGLSTSQLKMVLSKDPLQRFIPRKAKLSARLSGVK